MDARISRRQKRLSNKQEKRTASDIGGKTQANSGATRLGGGGDVRGNGIRIECKYTEKDSYTLRYTDLEKLRKQAIKTLEEPVFQIGFKGSHGMKMYAVIQWTRDLQSTVNDIYDLDTDAKSISLDGQFLRGRISEGSRIRLTFREGPAGRQYEIMAWIDFLEELEERNRA